MIHDSFDKTSHTTGDVGEVLTSSTLRDLGFTLVRSLYLPYKDREVQVDIVVISGNDLFVIENKNYTAKIYGKETSRYWKAYYTDECFEFLNPVVQNDKHCYALKQLFPDYEVHNIVIFNDKAILKVTCDNVYLLPDFTEKYSNCDKRFDKIVYNKLLSYSDCSEERCRNHVEKLNGVYFI